MKTHCPHGHEYTEANTRRQGNKRKCRTCETAYSARYSKAHPEKNRASTKASREKRRDFIRDLKKKMKCSRCPESFWACLDFHHRNPKEKEFEIREAQDRGASVARILAEIAKCDVLCANCHRKEHYEGS